MRPGSLVRAATGDDVDALVELCLVARAEAGTGSALCTDDASRLRENLLMGLGLPGAVALVATQDDQIDGLLLARIVGPSVFSDTVAVDLEAVYVARGARRRGVGHGLLSRLVELGADAGATDIVVAPLRGARGMQRFLARVGFQSVAAHRVTTTAALSRRLAADPAAPRTGAIRRVAPSGVDRLIALRRKARSEPTTAELAVQPAASSSSRQVRRAVAMRRPPASSTSIS